MAKQRIATEVPSAVIVQWFCDCGGELVAMSNTGRIVTHPVHRELPLMLFLHKCKGCGIQLEDRQMFPLFSYGHGHDTVIDT